MFDPSSTRSPTLPRRLCLVGLLALVPQAGWAQHGAGDGGGTSFAQIVSLVEVPFLLMTVVFAFLTARALKGGAFGRGMGLMAVGFLVMAVGHLHLLVLQWTDFNLFASLLGSTGGNVAWVLALLVTWGCSGMGFYSLYRASASA